MIYRRKTSVRFSPRKTSIDADSAHPRKFRQLSEIGKEVVDLLVYEEPWSLLASRSPLSRDDTSHFLYYLFVYSNKKPIGKNALQPQRELVYGNSKRMKKTHVIPGGLPWANTHTHTHTHTHEHAMRRTISSKALALLGDFFGDHDSHMAIDFHEWTIDHQSWLVFSRQEKKTFNTRSNRHALQERT